MALPSIASIKKICTLGKAFKLVNALKGLEQTTPPCKDLEELIPLLSSYPKWKALYQEAKARRSIAHLSYFCAFAVAGHRSSNSGSFTFRHRHNSISVVQDLTVTMGTINGHCCPESPYQRMPLEWYLADTIGYQGPIWQTE
jgi:hypothetical protein